MGTGVAKSSRMVGAAVGAAGKTDRAHTGGDTRADPGDAVFDDEAVVGLKTQTALDAFSGSSRMEICAVPCRITVLRHGPI